MKRLILSSVILLAAGVGVRAAEPAINFRITVEQQTDTNRDVAHKGGVYGTGHGVATTPKVTTEQKTRSFVIKLHNLTPSPVDKCTVRYTIYSGGQHGDSLRPVATGAREVSFTPMQQVQVETEAVQFRGAELKDVTGRVRGQRESYGQEYKGIVVEVERNGKVVATYMDPPSLKQDLEVIKANPLPNRRLPMMRQQK